MRSKSELVEEFKRSMMLDFDAWHDGTGYDLNIIAKANAEEREEIAELLIPPKGWRDVEALSALDTPTSAAALRKAMKSEVGEVRTAVARLSPPRVTAGEKTKLLVRALTTGKFYDDMTSALQQVEEHHPKPVIDAMFRALFTQTGDVACHLAAMLTFVHGKAETNFDWDKRPLFLKFNTDSQAERRAAFTELCSLLELDDVKTIKRLKISV